MDSKHESCQKSWARKTCSILYEEFACVSLHYIVIARLLSFFYARFCVNVDENGSEMACIHNSFARSFHANDNGAQIEKLFAAVMLCTLHCVCVCVPLMPMTCVCHIRTTISSTRAFIWYSMESVYRHLPLWSRSFFPSISLVQLVASPFALIPRSQLEWTFVYSRVENKWNISLGNTGVSTCVEHSVNITYSHRKCICETPWQNLWQEARPNTRKTGRMSEWILFG